MYAIAWILVSLIAIEAFLVLAFPNAVKKVIGDAQSGYIRLAGAIEAAIVIAAGVYLVSVCPARALPGSARTVKEERERLARENARLAERISELKRSRMLVPHPDDGEGSFRLPGTGYWLHHIVDMHYQQTGRSDLAYYWTDGNAFAINPLAPSVPRAIECRWPLAALSPDGSHAVVYNEKSVPCLANMATQELVATFDILVRRRFSGICARWLFSPDGKFAYPLTGGLEDGYPYIDVQRAEVKLLPLLEGAKVACTFSGVSLEGGRSLLIFAKTTVFESEHKLRYEHFSIRIEAGAPDDATVETDTMGIRHAFGVKDGAILCVLADGAPALLSSDTLKVIAAGAAPSNDNVHWMGVAPVEGDVYVVWGSRGLQICDGNNLKGLADIREGGMSNANSIGVTFSEDGRQAYVTTPYRYHFSVVDTSKRELVANVALKRPAAGVLMWSTGKRLDNETMLGTCLVMTTMLPYE